jgi:tetratricopeptide (TPR) repeat protein
MFDRRQRQHIKRILPVGGVIMAVFWLGWCNALQAAPLTIDADRQFAFSKQLLEQSDFKGAVVEFERFVFFFPQDRRIAQARYLMGTALLEDGQQARAISVLRRLAANTDENAYFDKAWLLIAEAYLRTDASQQALTTLQNLALETRTPRIRAEAYYRMGWIYLSSHAWDRAIQSFEKIEPAYQDRYQLAQLRQGIERARATPLKNPQMAGLLAALPGAGYLYLGRYRDALIAFVLNGACMYGTYEAFNNDLNALGGILAVASLTFYSGSIYGSISGAHKYNDAAHQKAIRNLNQQFKIDWMGQHPTDIGLRVSWAF